MLDHHLKLARGGRGGVIACAVTACAILVVGCGNSSQKKQAQQLEGASILSSTAPLSQRLITQREIGSTSDVHGQQTFLRLWYYLQYQSWDQAADLFQPGLRNAITPALLTEALAGSVLFWQGTKPSVVSVTASGSTSVITFMARLETGTVSPLSISFEREGGAWRVSYFSALNFPIQRAAQLRAQAQIEPLATKPSPEAVRQGAAAALIQSTYHERQLRAKGGTP